MAIDEIYKDLITKLMELPDLTGLNRCAGFFMVYQGLSILKQQVDEMTENHKNEVLALQAEIQDLKDQLEEKEQGNGAE